MCPAAADLPRKWPSPACRTSRRTGLQLVANRRVGDDKCVFAQAAEHTVVDVHVRRSVDRHEQSAWQPSIRGILDFEFIEIEVPALRAGHGHH